ncbi:MAG: toll/interleukin-1 receptor domain-containing protein [Bacteroidota bacterium]
MSNPKVFISYSWDDDDHKKWVLDLANKLSSVSGVHVILDQYDLFAGKNMTHYMEKSVDEADKVITILTPNYKKKADDRTGGVGYEYSMITSELFTSQNTNNKFIPVRRVGSYSESAPKFLGALVSHDMTAKNSLEIGYDELVKIIFNQPIIQRPKLGQVPSFIVKEENLKLLEDTSNLSKSKMTRFANWRFSIQIQNIEIETPEMYRYIIDNRKFDHNDKIYLPQILNDVFKVRHHPTIDFERPLQKFLYANLFINEKLQIHPNIIYYEFSEYSDQEMLLLNLNHPFTTIFHLLVILKRVSEQENITLTSTIKVKFESNSQPTLYQNYSPFDFGFHMEVYKIPDGKFETQMVLQKISIETLYKFYQKLYNAFISENRNSKTPYVTINRDNFESLVSEFMK